MFMKWNPGPLWAPEDGAATGAGKTTGEGTPALDDESKLTGARHTDDDLAKAKRMWERKSEKAVAEASKAAVGQMLSDLDFESIDDLRDTIGKLRGDEDKSEQYKREQRQIARNLAAITAERDELRKVLAGEQAKSKRATLEKAVRTAAKEADAFEDDVLARLLMNNSVGVDEDGVVFVRDSSGEPVHGSSVKKLVDQLLKDNEQLRRPSRTQGAGSLPAAQQATTGNSKSPKTPAEMAKALQAIGFGEELLGNR